MTMPIPAAAFASRRLAPHASIGAGIDPAIDAVADAAAASHRFLRARWFAATVATYGGEARTLIVHDGAIPVLALPFVRSGPAWLGLASVPGCYWPFRSVPVAEDVGGAVFVAALGALRGAVTALRIGPVYDGDAGAAPLIAAARAEGWAVLDRFVADSFLLDIAERRAEAPWPRGSTLKKNRFHEKHLAAHGALDWRFESGAAWDDALFAELAAVERASWIAARTDGRDAKFASARHGAFWRAVAGDPAIAARMRAAVLRIDGRAAAFSFDLDTGALRYAVANSYDPAFAKHSPGKLLYYRNLVDAIAGGVTRVDWGAGDSGYKQVIGATKGPAIRDWLLVRPGVAAVVGQALAGVWRRSGNRPD